MTHALEHGEKAQMTAVHSAIVASMVIFLIILICGIMADSITLLLDASAEFIILLTAFIMRVGIKKINLPPDNLFNFGYDKYEPFIVVIQGAMIMLSCVIALTFAIQDIIHADDIVRYDIPVLASLLSGIIAVLVAFYLKRVAVKTRSRVLGVSSLHWFIDSALSFAMFLGFSFGWYMYKLGYFRITPYVDPVMAVILALVFVWTPLKAMKNSFRELLDATPEKDVRDKIEKVIESHKSKVFGIRSIRMRKAGEKVFLYISFIIYGYTTMTQAQELTKSFEKDIAALFPKYDTIVYFYPAQ